MFSHRQPSRVYPPTGDPRRGTVLHISTLAVFLLGMVGQGFSPCPHHTSLDSAGHAQPGMSTEVIPGGIPHGDATPADSESEHDKALCSCLNACDAESGDSFSPGRIYTQPLSFTALNVVERLHTTLLDTRQNAYVAPLPQPPPHSS